MILIRSFPRPDFLQHLLGFWQYHDGHLSDHWQDQGEYGEQGQRAVECYGRCQSGIAPSVLDERPEGEMTTDRANRQSGPGQPSVKSLRAHGRAHNSLDEEIAEATSLCLHAIPLVVQGMLAHKMTNPTSDSTSPVVIASHLIACVAVSAMDPFGLHSSLPLLEMVTRFP